MAGGWERTAYAQLFARISPRYECQVSGFDRIQLDVGRYATRQRKRGDCRGVTSTFRSGTTPKMSDGRFLLPIDARVMRSADRVVARRCQSRKTDLADLDALGEKAARTFRGDILSPWVRASSPLPMRGEGALLESHAH